MKKCKECGADVSSKAETCPQCGAPLKSKQLGCGSTIAVIILGVIIFATIGSIFDNGSDPAPNNSTTDSHTAVHPATPQSTTTPATSTGEPQQAINSHWTYDTSPDRISGKNSETATIVSTNSLHLRFPYSGTNHGYITIRQHPQFGLDVIVSVDKGQILCGLDTCTLKIRFDDGPAQDFTMAPSADLSTTVVFARHPQWAINHLMKARTIIVQLPMYQEGNQLLQFEVQKPLIWPPK